MHHYLFDWGDTLMADLPGQTGPMCDWTEVRVVANAALALSRLTELAKCHLATNAKDSDLQQIRKALTRGGLDQWIDQVFCFRSIGYLKPSAEYFKFIADKLRVAKHEMTLVGDDLGKDVLGASRFGINAIWYNPKKEMVPDGIVAIADLNELPDLAPQSGVAAAAASRPR